MSKAPRSAAAAAVRAGAKATAAATAAAMLAPKAPATVHDGAPLVSVAQPNGAVVIIPETATKAPATSVAPVLSFDFAASGASLARADAQRARLVSELGEHLKCECLTLPAWEAARAAFIEGAKSTGYLAPDKLWERVIKQGQELGIVPDKPKAATAESSKKAAQREKKADRIEALAKSASPQDLLKQSAAASLKGDAGAALDLLTAAKRAQADADKAARDAASTEIEKHASAIRAALRRLEKSGDVKALASIAKVALKFSPEPAPATV
jgi:hypothetical protein